MSCALLKSTLLEIFAISGVYFSISSIIVDALNMNIPLFQKYVPAARYFLAVSRSGFSTNSLTLYPFSIFSKVFI